MKILIYSPAFHPSVGGLETLVAILAQEFVRQGHEARLVSQVPAADSKTFSFEVIRRPGPRSLLSLTRWCEVFFQPHMSLKGAWPLLLKRRPWVVAHNAWYTRPDGGLALQDRLKHFAARFATGISVSHAVAAHVSTPSKVIPNTYREDIFYARPEISRDKDLVFLGRLVSSKGADLLLEALAHLKNRGLSPALTVVGGGPEEGNLRRLSKELGVAGQVEFVGVKSGEELSGILNAHKILVVPSRWQEPFGIVALEGIACGCVIVGSEGGGLKDAIGPCGVTFPNEDVGGLARALADLLVAPDRLAAFRANAESHLSRHKTEDVAKAYLQVFESAIRQG
ncbi:MAG TPA: glycosyltransferase family 4 protein [Blastocatellia bacterium]|nr:glycosyltransferase family 4 protein [Blastocatellia bacterium]